MTELEKAQLERLTLERAATALERKAANKVYMSAWKAAAKLIRAMKPDLNKC